MPPIYNWKRFWCRREHGFNLTDNGFLYDPESEYGKLLNPSLVSFEHLTAKPCLALLGEPGIGKSFALEREKKDLAGGPALWLDLRSFGSEDRLWKALFESEDIRKWRQGNYVLTVFLDSLDECLLRINNVASLIADQLPNEPVERLRFRIACRTAPWPHILEQALIEAYGPTRFEAYELVPLRREDVKEAAMQSGIAQPDAFIQRIEALDVVSLAIKPVTLTFLIKSYRQDGDLAKNQIELYERGCRILCEEVNESRRAAGQTGALDSSQRLDIAARIAAMTQFCNRYAIWTGAESDSAREDITIPEISGGTEPTTSNMEVSAAMIREVLDTGLFSSRGPNRVGWAHQTYAEFLAARYSKIHSMPPGQIRDLIVHPVGETKKLIPQLRQLAGWIAVMVPGILEIVAQSDPESLLGTAGTNLSDAQRQTVTKILLDQSDAGRMLNLHPELYREYRKLKHPGLGEQLKLYLNDSGRKRETRQVAIDIARSCELQQVAGELADIAVDTSQPMEIRIPAAGAAAELGDKNSKARLRPLAFGEAGDDPDDELKGSGLTALWPDLITTAELFSLLSMPKNRNLFGSYSSFLDYQLVPALKPADLVTALEWCSSQGARTAGPIDRVLDQIIQLAWDHLEEAGVAAALARTVISRVRLHDRIMSGLDRSDFEKRLGTEHERRRKLLTEILPQIMENELYFLRYAGLPIISELDLPWLIEQVHLTSGPAAMMFAKLAHRITDSSNPEHMRCLELACRSNQTLRAECRDLFEPIMLDSEHARILRQSFENPQPVQPPLLDPPPKELVARDLAEIEAGNILKWIQLTWDLSLEATSSHCDQRRPDLTAMAGWSAADSTVQRRIIQAALRYIKEGEPQNQSWFETDQVFHEAVAGFRALALLLMAAPDEFANIPAEAWPKWAAICVRYPDDRDAPIRERLLQEVHQRAPNEVDNRLIRLIDLTRGQQYFSLSTEVELCWDQEMASALLARVEDPTLSNEFFKALLRLLLRYQADGARELARSFILNRPPSPGPEKERMFSAMEALISDAQDAGWTDIWPVLEQQPSLGKELIASVAYSSYGRQAFLKNLTEDQLGTFYRWMLTAYPPSASDHKVSGAVGPIQAAIMLRDQILEHLKKRSSFAASGAIRDVREALPQHPWLALHWEEAEELARAATWQPILPRQFLVLAANSSKRLLDSTEQLVELILESLNRLAEKLHGELPAVRDLWNVDKSRYWPKDENDFSDYVTRHLDDDIQGRGIVVNREVQIRRGAGGGTGEFTDIHVDAIIPGTQPGSYARVYVIVEAKGNWHAELFTAMETQLRDRYLKENRCQAGVYLVGWFSCARWADQDSRKADCPQMPIDDARIRLEDQARTLSITPYHIRAVVADCTLP